MRSRRAGVSVVIVYRQSMCAACTDSAVTGRDACTGRFVVYASRVLIRR